MKIMNIRKISVNLADSTMKVVFRRRIVVRLKVFLPKNQFLVTHPKLNLGWIPKDFKIFIFKPQMSFLNENEKNYN